MKHLQHRLLELQTLTLCNPESGILTIAEATATRMMWLQSRHVDLFDASILVLRVSYMKKLMHSLVSRRATSPFFCLYLAIGENGERKLKNFCELSLPSFSAARSMSWVDTELQRRVPWRHPTWQHVVVARGSLGPGVHPMKGRLPGHADANEKRAGSLHLGVLQGCH